MAENQDQRNDAADLVVEGSGKTLADAEADAMERLEQQAGEFDLDDIELQVLDEGSKGFLGMGSNRARVKISLRGGAALAPEPEAEPAAPGDEPAMTETDMEGEAETTGEETVPTAEGPAVARERLSQYLDRIVSAFGLDGEVTITEDDETLTGNINGGDLGIFIGRHGQTIDAVQYLANVIAFRGLEGRKRVVIDAEDYRERRAAALHSLAERAVSEIEKGKAEYELKPMSAAERRIIHLYLQEREGVDTISEGRDPYRHVIIIAAED